jgi:hypothetical protein
MSELKHFKGKDWEIKVKYDEDMEMVLWKERKGQIERSIPFHHVDMLLVVINENESYSAIFEKEVYNQLIEHLSTIERLELEDNQPELTLKDWLQEMYNLTKKYADYFERQGEEG